MLCACEPHGARFWSKSSRHRLRSLRGDSNPRHNPLSPQRKNPQCYSNRTVWGRVAYVYNSMLNARDIHTVSLVDRARGCASLCKQGQHLEH